MKNRSDNDSNSPNGRQHFWRSRPRLPEDPTDFAQIAASTGTPLALAANAKRRRVPSAKLRCECSHAKSIHSRMYANPKLGTSCNYPGCRCKAYKAGSAAGKGKARR
jgi:hypothetical protein